MGHIFYDSTYIKCQVDKSIETEWFVVARGWIKEEWGVIANGYGFFCVCVMKTSLN